MSALPDWTDPLYEAAEMRAADAWAIEEQGVPEADLMERAGLGLARVTASVAAAGPVRIVVGKGNNGGDGLVAARLLREDGYEVDVLDGTEPFERERLTGSGVVVGTTGGVVAGTGSPAGCDAALGVDFVLLLDTATNVATPATTNAATRPAYRPARERRGVFRIWLAAPDSVVGVIVATRLDLAFGIGATGALASSAGSDARPGYACSAGSDGSVGSTPSAVATPLAGVRFALSLGTGVMRDAYP